MPAPDDIQHFNGPIPRIFETDDAYCVVVMKLLPDNVIDTTISIDDGYEVPTSVTAQMLRNLADSIECDHA